jgi:hypothetical protein
MNHKKRARNERRKKPLWRLKALMRSGRGIILLGPATDALSELELIYGLSDRSSTPPAPQSSGIECPASPLG